MKIRPRNWKSFQHYADRRPAWVKLHRGLLDDYEFHCLPTASQALAPLLWLVASEHEHGEIDADSAKLAFRFRKKPSEIEEALKWLIAANFFEVMQDASEPLADDEQNGVSEERENLREEERRGTAVRVIFDHWRETHRKPNAKLDAQRERKIRAALKEFSEEQLRNAISGYASSPFHNGQNNTGTKYDEITLILRDTAHIEKGLEFFAAPPKPNGSHKSSETDAIWARVRACIQHGEWADDIPQRARLAVGEMGGLKSLGMRQSDKIEFTRREFCDAYARQT